MKKFKKMMQSLLVLVLTAAMTLQVAPEVDAYEGDTDYGSGWAGLYLQGSEAFYQNQDENKLTLADINLEVALYCDGELVTKGLAEGEKRVLSSSESVKLEDLDKYPDRDVLQEQHVYTWKIVNGNDIPVGYIVDIVLADETVGENAYGVNFYVKYYLESEGVEQRQDIFVNPRTNISDPGIQPGGPEDDPSVNPGTGEDDPSVNPGNGDNKPGKGEVSLDDLKPGDEIVSEDENKKDVDVDPANPGKNAGIVTFQVVPAKSGAITLVKKAAGSVTVTAKPAKGYVFAGWEVTGGAKLAPKNEDDADTVTINYDKTKNGKVVAKFEKLETLTVGKVFGFKKYYYKVTKLGTATKAGTVQITGIRKAGIKVIKIAAKIKYGDVTYKVTSVKPGAFKGNKIVTKAYVGKNIKSIGANAFAKIKKLKTVSITSTKLKTIGKKAFYGDKKLRKIIVKSKKLKKIGKYAFKGTKKLVIRVPKSKKKAYKKLVKRSKAKKVKVK